MRLRIGDRSGLRTPASDCEYIDPPGAHALRGTYRTLRRAGVSPLDARSVINTAYAVGNVAALHRLDDWYGAEGRRSSATRHPSTTGRVLTVVRS